MSYQLSQNHNVKNDTTINNAMQPMANLYRSGGIVSEIAYDEQQPFVFHLLLPFLQQLAQQPRWQLWLTPQQKLSRHWLMSVGLPENKIMQMPLCDYKHTVSMMEKALASGNYSTVLAWLPYVDEVTNLRLQRAAEQGDAYAFIMRPNINVVNNRCNSSFRNKNKHTANYH